MAYFGMGMLDYVLLCLVAVFTSIPGLYYMYRARNAKSTLDFLVSGKGLGLFPIIMSMSATFIAGLIIVGLPVDTYRHGIVMIGFVFGNILATPILLYLFLGVFFNTDRVSVFDYVEQRFNSTSRRFLSVILISDMVVSGANLIYISSVALNHATNVNIWYCVATISIVCTTYTAFGGFKAVVWTDVLQIMVMLAVLLAIVIKGYIELGGINEIWRRNSEGNRTTLSMHKQEDHLGLTIWPIMFGSIFHVLITSTGQALIQRSWSAKSISKAKVSTSISMIIISLFQFGFICIGMMIFAKFHDCDPLLSGKIKTRDQEIVLFISELFGSVQGMLGVFFAGLLCGNISSFSSFNNSSVCLIMGDFIKPLNPGLKEKKLLNISRLVGIIWGLICTLLIVLLQQIPGLTTVLFIQRGVFGGPILGTFTLGMLSPWTGVSAAATGCLVSMLFIGWASIGRIITNPVTTTAPLSTIGCSTSLALNMSNFTSTVNIIKNQHSSELVS